jgi:hypothetical protein
MAERSVVRISVEGRAVGIVGLQEIFADLTARHAEASDETIAGELLDRLAAENYVPQGARAAYGKALLREFKKTMGEPVEEEDVEGLHIAVLGPGCFNCDRLEGMIRDVMAEMQIAGDLDHVTDPKEIARYGLLGVPAVVINGRVVSAGTMPVKVTVRRWLQSALEAQRG